MTTQHDGQGPQVVLWNDAGRTGLNETEVEGTQRRHDVDVAVSRRAEHGYQTATQAASRRQVDDDHLGALLDHVLERVAPVLDDAGRALGLGEVDAEGRLRPQRLFTWAAALGQPGQTAPKPLS